MDIEQIRLWFEIAGYAAGIGSLLFLAIQLRKERKLEEYKLLQSLEQKYTKLLWKSSEDSEINNVWLPITAERVEKFNDLSDSCSKDSWPIWNEMNSAERNCYRFTRAGFEILEQSYIAKNRGWINDIEIWRKWKGWMISWKNTNSYVPYVLMEMRYWFSPSFLEYFDSLEP